MIFHQSEIKYNLRFFGIIAGFLLLFMACTHTMPLKIGISKATPNYERWLLRTDSTLTLVNLYTLSIDSAVMILGTCDALLLTGGEDVYPGWYGKEKDTLRCTEMNPWRDSLDIALITKALEIQMPVFGICRGHQILNVYLGGTLFIDIPADFPGAITHQCEDYLNCFHDVTVRPNSVLSEISRCDSFSVTTNHHQAIDQISPILTPNAHSGDNLVEGIEWLHPDGKSFLMGVQWHPERMDKANPLSGPLSAEFIRQAYLYSALRNKNR